MDRIIRINMTDRTIVTESLPAEYKGLGGRGLTSRIVANEVPATAEPLGPRNKLVIAPGMLAGTVASSTGRLSIGGKSPLTGGIKEANGGGTAATKLARLNISALILEGQPSEKGPFIVVIRKDKAEILPRPDLAMLGTFDTAARLAAEFGKEAGQVLIGQAGEMLLRAAGVTNLDPDGNPSRYCARGGLGAVMGAKAVKAIIIDDAGCERPAAADDAAFKQVLAEYSKAILETPQTEVFRTLGTAAMVRNTNGLGALPTRNFQTGSYEEMESISGDKLRETIIARNGKPDHSCMPVCAIRCSNVYADQNGKTIVAPLEYETIGLVGSNCMISSLDDIAEINRLCNDYGVDTIDVGGALAIAMEAGIIPYGDGKAALGLVQEIAKGTVAGRLIGSGGSLAGKVLGVVRIPAVKGQIMAAYEPRGIKGLGVTYATSPMGADHTAGNTVRAAVDHKSPEGQVQASLGAQIGATVYDSLGACSFVGPAMKGSLDLLAGLVAARYGIECTADTLRAMGKATLKTEVSFNRAAGLGPETDDLPEWMRDEENPAAGTRFDVPKEELDSIFNNL